MRDIDRDVVRLALEWVGTPYRHQASARGAGCDCLGLIRGIWRGLYGQEPQALPPYRADLRDPLHADELEKAARRWLVPVETAHAGSVLTFRLNRAIAAKHCVVLVDTRTIVHAQEGLGVVCVPLAEGWQRRIAGSFDFPDKET